MPKFVDPGLRCARPAGRYGLLPPTPGDAAAAFVSWLVPACREWTATAQELLSGRA